MRARSRRAPVEKNCSSSKDHPVRWEETGAPLRNGVTRFSRSPGKVLAGLIKIAKEITVLPSAKVDGIEAAAKLLAS
jgi:hypothetical protein